MKTLLTLFALLAFGIGSAYAGAPCAVTKTHPTEFKEWKVVGSLHKGNFVIFINTVINPDPTAEIKSVIYITGPFRERDANGNLITKYDIFRFCYLDNGVVKDFAYCINCKCFHETLLSPKSAEDLKKRLMRAINAKTS